MRARRPPRGRPGGSPPRAAAPAAPPLLLALPLAAAAFSGPRRYAATARPRFGGVGRPAPVGGARPSPSPSPSPATLFRSSSLRSSPSSSSSSGRGGGASDESPGGGLRGRLRRWTGFSLTALRASLRATTGFSLTALRATVRAATGVSVTGTMRAILSVFPTWVRYFLQPFLILYYAPLMILRSWVGPTKTARARARLAHERVVEGWREAVRVAEGAQEGGYWPVHVDDDGNIVAALPPEPDLILGNFPVDGNPSVDVSDAVAESVEIAEARKKKEAEE